MCVDGRARGRSTRVLCTPPWGCSPAISRRNEIGEMGLELAVVVEVEAAQDSRGCVRRSEGGGLMSCKCMRQ